MKVQIDQMRRYGVSPHGLTLTADNNSGSTIALNITHYHLTLVHSIMYATTRKDIRGTTLWSIRNEYDASKRYDQKGSPCASTDPSFGDQLLAADCSCSSTSSIVTTMSGSQDDYYEDPEDDSEYYEMHEYMLDDEVKAMKEMESSWTDGTRGNMPTSDKYRDEDSDIDVISSDEIRFRVHTSILK